MSIENGRRTFSDWRLRTTEYRSSPRFQETCSCDRRIVEDSRTGHFLCLDGVDYLQKSLKPHRDAYGTAVDHCIPDAPLPLVKYFAYLVQTSQRWRISERDQGRLKEAMPWLKGGDSKRTCLISSGRIPLMYTLRHISEGPAGRNNMISCDITLSGGEEGWSCQSHEINIAATHRGLQMGKWERKLTVHGHSGGRR